MGDSNVGHFIGASFFKYVMKILLCAILVVVALPSAARGQDAAFLGKSVRVSVPLWTDSDAAPSGPSTRWNAETVRGPSFQLALGGEFARFRSSVFNSNNGGVHTSLTYFPKARLGIEGSVVGAFGSSNLNGEASRYLLYTAGPRFALRDYRLQPWLHALAGGLHVFPQTGFGRNGFAAQLGGGVDLRLTPLTSLRVESDYVRSQLFSRGQNSFQLGAGFVVHF